jgi:hypothetical protein
MHHELGLECIYLTTAARTTIHAGWTLLQFASWWRWYLARRSGTAASLPNSPWLTRECLGPEPFRKHSVANRIFRLVIPKTFPAMKEPPSFALSSCAGFSYRPESHTVVFRASSARRWFYHANLPLRVVVADGAASLKSRLRSQPELTERSVVSPSIAELNVLVMPRGTGSPR